MNKSFLHIASIIALFLISITSCNNEENDILIGNNNEKDIEVLNGNILRFKDENVYRETLDSLSEMNQQERLIFLSSINFNSQLPLITQADIELDEICERAKDAKEFADLYADYKQKYKDIFMFNDIDKEDLSPYSKLVYLDHEFFANQEGKFIIGDSVVVAPTFKKYSEMVQKNILTKGGTSSLKTDTNHAWSHTSDRKVGLYASMNNEGQIYMRFTAQKKYIFGWKRYSTVYFANFNLHGGQVCKFFWYTGEGSPQTSTVPMDGKDFSVETKELSGNETIYFGGVGPAQGVPYRFQYECSGWMEVWSRGISYENRGKSKIGLCYPENL